MAWSLYSREGKILNPLKFSNGKTQEMVTDEVLGLIKKGEKVIFIKGICGTGKSAIALNIARKLGKSSIVVPIKNLQNQYKKDYGGEEGSDSKYLLKENGERLNISVITGRANHKCKFLEDNKNIPSFKYETDSKLHDIFAGRESWMKSTKDLSADNRDLPCKIELKENNWKKIKEYLKQNKKVNLQDIDDIKDVKRVAVASVCPYWCPVVPEEYELKNLKVTKLKKYTGLKNISFTYHQRDPGCKFYEQFKSFIYSDVIVFNSLKYKLESLLNRKPETKVEIIDECDEFLDSFSNQKNINLDRLQNSLVNVFSNDEKVEEIIKEISEIIKYIRRNERINKAINSGEIIPLKETGFYDLLKIFLKSRELLEEIDSESYLYDVEETARMFEGFFEDSYLTLTKIENNLVASIVTTNLAKKFKEMIEKNSVIVLMSGTLHSEEVLKGIFGLDNFKIIEAEIESQGRIEVVKTGLEMDCKYSNFYSGQYSRGDYLKALDKCVEVAKKPALVHVNAFTDLPSEKEIEELKLKNLVPKEELRENQKEDKTGELIREFKSGMKNVLFSTRCSRGIDFPGEECNSIIFTKYPNPNVQDAFWKILMKTNPAYYWAFYKDKAKREIWQKVYRGLRSKNDHVFVLSPDERVLKEFEKK